VSRRLGHPLTEGYTGDYREVDPTNPGCFISFGILAQAFKTGTPKAVFLSSVLPDRIIRTWFWRRAPDFGFGEPG